MAGAQVFGPTSTFFPGTLVWNWIKLEQPRLEMVLIWDVSLTGSGLTAISQRQPHQLGFKLLKPCHVSFPFYEQNWDCIYVLSVFFTEMGYHISIPLGG